MPDVRNDRPRCVLRYNESVTKELCSLAGVQSEAATGAPPAHAPPAGAEEEAADDDLCCIVAASKLAADQELELEDHAEVAATWVAAAGPALILGMGTATPERAVSMKTYASNLGHNLGFAPADIQFAERICQNSQISTKYLAVPFERYRDQETGSSCPSWDVRLGWYEEEALDLAEVAARRALDSWRGPHSHVTHLLLYSTSGALSPSLDLRLLKRLGLPRGTRHFAVAFHGCHAGVLGLRTAAEIATGASAYLCGCGCGGQVSPARVLVVWVEVNSCHAAPPDPADPPNNVVVASIFGDGAAAAVVGAAQPPLAPDVAESPPLFEIRCCCSSFIDGSEDGIVARVRQAGLQVGLSKQVPELVARHAGEFARHLLSQVKGLTADSVNWAVHPGGRAIIDAVQQSCGLHAHQLRHSRTILDQYSNMGAPTIIFVLQLLLKEIQVAPTIIDWTLALAFGPGISIEGALLRRL